MRNRLLQLLADNRANPVRRPFEVCARRRAAAAAAGEQADEVDVYLYDAIVDTAAEAEWWGGVPADTFVRELRALDASVIHLRVNSPGGSVFAARAMEQALREHPARVVAHIDGLAASAASFVVMGANEIVIAPGAMVMIHKGWVFALGNADDLRATAELLDKVDGTLVRTYVERTGQPADQVERWMAAETWFTADEAVEHGFADRVAEAEPAEGEGAAAQAGARGAWNLQAYLQELVRRPAPAGAAATAATAGAAAASAGAAEASPATASQTPDHRARQRQRLALLARTAPIV